MNTTDTVTDKHIKRWNSLYLPSVQRQINDYTQSNQNSQNFDSVKKLNFGTAYALHQSVLDGRLKQVHYFLKLGLNVNSKDKFGRTSLMLACLCDFEEYGLQVAKLLLKFGADLNIRDTLGQNVLFIACTEKRDKFFDYLIENYSAAIDFKQKDNDGNCLINHVAIYGSNRMLKKIIEKMQEKKIELDQRNNSGYSALLLAIQSDNYLNAYTLIKDGQSSPSLQDNEKYYNALEWLLERIKTNKNLSLSNQSKSIRDSSASFYTQDLSHTSTSLMRGSNNSFIRGTNKSFMRGSNTNLKTNLNYKSWLTSNNQYFQSDKRCDHMMSPNYSIEHHKSRYVPLILKSHYLQNYNLTQNEYQRESYSSLNMTTRSSQFSKIDEKDKENEEKESEKENELLIDESTDLKELIQKLYETIYLKMSESFKTKQYSNANINKPSSPVVENDKSLVNKASKRTNSRAQSQNKKSTDQRVRVEEANKLQEDRAVSSKIFENRFEQNIFNMEALRKTPKLIALQPIYTNKQNTKEAVHSMLDLYVSNQNGQDFYSGSSSPFEKTDCKNNNNIIKEKSNLSEKSRMVSANSHVHFKGD
jgi:hypothetical protein